MTAINHALTGALVGLISGQPLVAIPVALASHFVCDALPHFGVRSTDTGLFKTKAFRLQLLLDAMLCGALVAVLADRHPLHWVLAALCAFVATSPDFAWIGKFVRANKGQKPTKGNWFTRWASDIQWFQRPPGAVVELAWAAGSGVLLWQFLR